MYVQSVWHRGRSQTSLGLGTPGTRPHPALSLRLSPTTGCGGKRGTSWKLLGTRAPHLVLLRQHRGDGHVTIWPFVTGRLLLPEAIECSSPTGLPQPPVGAQEGRPRLGFSPSGHGFAPTLGKPQTDPWAESGLASQVLGGAGFRNAPFPWVPRCWGLLGPVPRKSWGGRSQERLAPMGASLPGLAGPCARGLGSVCRHGCCVLCC